MGSASASASGSSRSRPTDVVRAKRASIAENRKSAHSSFFYCFSISFLAFLAPSLQVDL